MKSWFKHPLRVAGRLCVPRLVRRCESSDASRTRRAILQKPSRFFPSQNERPLVDFEFTHVAKLSRRILQTGRQILTSAAEIRKTKFFYKKESTPRFTCTLLALICKCLIINGAGEGNQIHHPLSVACVTLQPCATYVIPFFA